MKTKASRLGTSKRLVAAAVLGTALSTMIPHASGAEACAATLQAVTAIDRYCTACWRNAHIEPGNWSDCTQEVFARLLERIAPGDWDRVLRDDAEERREFIRAIDTVKKRSQRQKRYNSAGVDSFADRRNESQVQRSYDREAVQRAAAELLTDRQRQILNLSFDGWTVSDMAGKLGIPSARVSDEKYKAIHKLQECFAPADACGAA